MTLQEGYINVIDFPPYITPGGTLKLNLTLNMHYGITSLGTLNHKAEDAGLHIHKIEPRKQSWDEKEFFIVLGELKIHLIDAKNELKHMLFSQFFDADWTRIWYARYTPTYEVLFEGYFNNATEYSVNKDRIFNCTFSPQTQKLAKLPSNVNGVWYDAFNGKYIDDPGGNNFYNLKDLITDFFNLVNPGITVDFYCNWDFESAYINGQYHYCDFTGLKVRFKSVWKNAAQGYAFRHPNYMATLKSLLFSLGLFGGFISNTKAFIKCFYDFIDTSTLINLTPSLILDYKKSSNKKPLKYVDLLSNSYRWASAGTASLDDDENMHIQISGDIFQVLNAAPLARIRGLGLGYTVWTNFLLNLFSQYYLQKRFYPREDSLKLLGTNYSIVNSFEKDSLVFIPKEVNINDCENFTEMKLLAIGDYEGEVLPLLNPIVYEPPAPNEEFGVVVNDTKLGEIITPFLTESTYTLNSSFVPKSTRLYFNGVRLKPGDDYNEILPNQVQLLIDIPMDANIIIDYEIT